jgi:hypothetical protein
MNSIKYLWQNKPLTLILWLAIVFRLISVIFSKGFGMHDDHFLVIEASQSWVDGTDYNNWLPGSYGNTTPSGHSFFYVGFHYIFLSFLKFMGFDNPQAKMFIIRFLHAAFSLLTVYYGYKIAEKLSNKKTASTIGLLLAIYWFMPFVSVRNLVEIVCIPFLLIGTYLLIDIKNRKKILLFYFISGVLFGLAFSIRYQTIMYCGGVGLAILIQKKWKEAFVFGVGIIASIFLIQGGIDTFVWGYPFAELGEYISYNLINAHNYNTLPWYSLILFMFGILIPPISVLLFFGFFKSWKKHLIIFLPTLIFIAFHSYFPNKQERFIFPIIPFVIILGMIGWNEFYEKSRFWQKRKILYKSFWIFFWVINLIFLPVISTMYSKKARVESMTYLSKYENIPSLLMEETNDGNDKIPPQFYLNQWIDLYYLPEKEKIGLLNQKLQLLDAGEWPAFIIFYDDKNIDQRVDLIGTIIPNLKYETTIEPGFIDKVLNWLNPHNANQTIVIYRNTDIFPEQKIK